MTVVADSPIHDLDGSEETERLRVLIVDDHQLLAQSLALALDLEGIECTLADLGDRDELVRCVAADPSVLVLLDLDLGGAIGDGSTLVGPFVRYGARVLVVSATNDPDQVAHALQHGAVDAVGKDVPFTHLLDVVLAAANGVPTTAAADRRRLLREAHERGARRARELAPFARLSDREREVLRALVQGSNVARIAEANVVSEATVRSQVRAILVKLDVGSQLEAVARARRCAWV